MKKDLELPEGWELYDTQEKEWKGDKYFWKRYVHKESKSGINYFSTYREGKKVFVVEGYGIGTIDPYKFKEIAAIAPIQRYERDSEEKAEEALINLMKENMEYWIKYSEGNFHRGRDFETAKEIVEKYKPKGEISKKDGLRLLKYCRKTKCKNCRLSKRYGKCPVVISLVLNH